MLSFSFQPEMDYHHQRVQVPPALNLNLMNLGLSNSSYSTEMNFHPTTNLPNHILGALAYKFTFQDIFQTTNQIDPNGSQLPTYMTLLLVDTSPSLEIILTCIIYFRSLYKRCPNWVTTTSPCLVFTTCLILAFKFISDTPHFSTTWTTASGFDSLTLNRAERVVLQHLDYELYIPQRNLIPWVQYAKESIYQLYSPPLTPTYHHPHPSTTTTTSYLTLSPHFTDSTITTTTTTTTHSHLPLTKLPHHHHPYSKPYHTTTSSSSKLPPLTTLPNYLHHRRHPTTRSYHHPQSQFQHLPTPTLHYRSSFPTPALVIPYLPPNTTSTTPSHQHHPSLLTYPPLSLKFTYPTLPLSLTSTPTYAS